MGQVIARRLRKEFGEVAAVDGVDLEVRDGEFMVFLGPSGCGKTTILRMIAGLEQPSSGDIVIGNRVVNALPPRSRGIAMVFQGYGLYPHLKVRDNIAFPLRTQGTPREAIEKKVTWAASILGITRLLERKPRQLSGGEQQRVALARALVREPTVFLLDEPLSNLDAKLRTSARNEIKEFQRGVRTTTIYVTHDQVEAMGLGDRIAVLEHGKLRQVGTPSQIYEDPADTFVATFLGAPPMNLLERGELIEGFRPENFLHQDLQQKGIQSARYAFTVQRIEYLGNERILYGLIDGQRNGAEYTARMSSHVSEPVLREGETYPFTVHPKNLKYFDKSTGKRLPPARNEGRA
ncbi:MAG TPA: ABC transporter ATP-binding protein [Burkholderiales bacterium]|jgi:multiple sugar transport system ATP-binding protein|nr:ABC transporter ATP-binding protein [Burkholderiales bacterium]